MPAEANNPVELLRLFEMDDEQFRERFRRTPLWRTRRPGVLRNAAIALGNRPMEEAIPALQRGLHDNEPLVRGASAWALGQIATSTAQEALRKRRELEDDAEVIAEIEAALRATGATACGDDVTNRPKPDSTRG